MLHKCLSKAVFKQSYHKAKGHLYRCIRIWGLEQDQVDCHCRTILFPLTITLFLSNGIKTRLIAIAEQS